MLSVHVTFTGEPWDNGHTVELTGVMVQGGVAIMVLARVARLFLPATGGKFFGVLTGFGWKIPFFLLFWCILRRGPCSSSLPVFAAGTNFRVFRFLPLEFSRNYKCYVVFIVENKNVHSEKCAAIFL